MGLSPLQRLTCPVRCVFRLGWKHDQVLFSGDLAPQAGSEIARDRVLTMYADQPSYCEPTPTVVPPVRPNSAQNFTPAYLWSDFDPPGLRRERWRNFYSIYFFLAFTSCRGKVHQWLCIHIYIFNLPWLCWTLVNCWDRVWYLIRSRRLRFYS